MKLLVPFPLFKTGSHILQASLELIMQEKIPRILDLPASTS